MAELTPHTTAEKIALCRTEKAMSMERNADARHDLWMRIKAAIARADADEERGKKGGRPRRICVGWRMR